MAIPNYDSVGDATSAVNAKAFGDAGAHTALQAAQQLAAHNSRMNMMAESVYAQAANKMLAPDPVEAISVVKLLTGRESSGISEALSLAQTLVKTAQTTPPVTP